MTRGGGFLSDHEITFNVMGLRIAGKRWGRGTIRVLALHARFDNADSFSRLAPMLENIDLVAVDLPGHGLSEHKPVHASYNSWSDVPFIAQIIHQLGWECCHLIGHCRGGMIAALTAVSLPKDRIASVILLEPPLVPNLSPVASFDHLSSALSSVGNDGYACGNLYKNIEAMLGARKRAGVSREAAAAMIDRGAVPSTNVFWWRADVRLQKAAIFDLSSEHINILLKKLEALPVLLIFSTQGMGGGLQRSGFMQSLMLPWELLAGSHHFHLESEAALIAQRVQRLWEQVESTRKKPLDQVM